MQSTMTNVGNSLAFWKKSAPKDQFATNLTSPAKTGTPTGAYGPNSMAQNQPSNYPFANAGNRQNASSQPGFGQSTNVASNTTVGTRSPYNTSYPSNPSSSANQTQFGAGQSGAGQTGVGQSGVRTASTNSNNFSGSTGGYTPPASNSGFTNSYGNPSRVNTSTPSSQFQSNSSYQPNSGSFAPSTAPNTNSNGSGFSPSSNNASETRSAAVPASYPKTPYGEFGVNQSAPTPTTTAPASSSSFGSTTPGVTMSSSSGFNPNASTASTSATPPSSTITRPPSLPQSVFSKSGGYSPGSTGVSGTATQAGFQSQDLYNPNTASKIPTQKNDLYTPGQ